MCRDAPGAANLCPFLRSIANLKDADNIVATKALARKKRFFSAFGNKERRTVVLDEDPIGLLRPAVTVTRDDLRQFMEVMKDVETLIRQKEDLDAVAAGLAEAVMAQRIADWLWAQLARQRPDGRPEAVDVPANLRPERPVVR